jgi:DNA-binding transcriptional ArsR family regulator
MLAAALYYARCGWAVFPLHTPLFDDYGNCIGCTCEAWKRANVAPDYKCTNPGKCPRVRWSERSTTDEEQIRKWWGRPNAWDGQLPNIGIDCGRSGLLALDVDAYKEHAGDITDFLTIAEQSTVTVVTGGGGQHLLYRAGGKPYGNSTGSLPAGIDVRGVGGYIVVAPSVHKSGQLYMYEEGYGPRDVELAPIPSPLDEILAAAHEEHTTSTPARFTQTSTPQPDLSQWQLSQRAVQAIHTPAPKGERSEADMSVCLALVYAGAADDDILAVFEHFPIGTEGKYADSGRAYLAHTVGEARAWAEDHPRPTELIEKTKHFLLTQDIGAHVPNELKAKRRDDTGEIIRYEYRTRRWDRDISIEILNIMADVGRVEGIMINAYQVVRGVNSKGEPVQRWSHKTVGAVINRMGWLFDATPTDRPHTWKVTLKVDVITFPPSNTTIGSIRDIDDTGKVIITTFDHWKNDDPYGAGTSRVVRDRIRKEVLAEAAQQRERGIPVNDETMRASYIEKLGAKSPGLGTSAILIIQSLIDAGGSGATAQELADSYSLTTSSVGGVLRKLRALGLIESQRRYKQASLHFIDPQAFEWIAEHVDQFRTHQGGVKRLDQALESAQRRADKSRAGRVAQKRFATLKALYPSWNDKERAEHIYGGYKPKRIKQGPAMPEPGQLAWGRLTELTSGEPLDADEFGELQSLNRVLNAKVGTRYGEVYFARSA